MSKPDLSGQHVGPYHLTNILGGGAAGNVYRAVDTTSKQAPSFAVKCLSRVKSSRQRDPHLAVESHLQEAVAGSPHVVALRNIIEEERYLFLVLDLCETDMYKLIRRKKLYWRNDALIRQAFIEVLDGVSACHEKKVFHRDLKPDNIMCNAGGTGIQIGDFGMATHHLVSRDGGCGTPNYMSPESWASEEGDPYFSLPTDIWSLGIILFNMVTNRSPWEAALPSDREFKAFIDDKDHLYHISPISGQLNDLLKWIMHPIPWKRLPIPVIRKVVLEMDTFYKRRRALPATSPLSKEVAFADSEQTCVEHANIPDKEKLAVASPGIRNIQIDIRA